MIPVSVMVAGKGTVSYDIKGRFDKKRPSRFSGEFRPIVAWNITYKCNLKCVHCYINAGELGAHMDPNLMDKIANELIDKGLSFSLEEGLELELSYLEKIFKTEDAYEGLKSVLERRRPGFKGR